MNVEMLLDLIGKSPTAFHAVATVKDLLLQAGFAPLTGVSDGLPAAGDYFVERNGSSLIAFRVPENYDPSRLSLRVSAAHGDSPCFRLKPNALLNGAYGRLNTELYGGFIYSSWMDRPLALAGRVMVRSSQGISARLAFVDRPVAVIPNTAPHLRDMNGGLVLDPKCDLVPLFGAKDADLMSMIASSVDAEACDVVGWDLSLVAQGKGFTFGPEEEFICSPRLDDLECVYTCLDGFLSAPIPEHTVPVFALFDNEETGSLSYAGAAGTLMKDFVSRVLPGEAFRQQVLSRSFFVSADNAHGLHPNHPELSDGQNVPLLNGGPAVKYNACQRYVSDGFSGAVFSEICRRAEVPVQVFANRSDKRGGSTLGNLSEAQVPLRGVDIGAAQLAMHSAWETAGSLDVEWMTKAMTALYACDFSLSADGVSWN